MAAYLWADVSGTTLASFDPATDTLLFPAPLSAASLTLLAAGADTVVSIGGSSVILAGLGPGDLDGTQFIFGDGTLWRKGSTSGDSYLGSFGADAFDLRAGGADSVSAGDGNDVIDLGDTLDAADVIDGEGGQDDVLRLAGNYADIVALGDTTIRGVENFILGTGGTIRLQLSNGLLSSATPASSQSVLFDGLSQTAADAVYLDGRLALKQFQAVMGAGDDTVLGGARDDTLAGGDGANLLVGHGSNDRVESGAFGNSTLLGGAGDDTLTVTAGATGTSGLVMAGGSGSDVLVGGEGDDALSAAGWQDAIGEGATDEAWTTNQLDGRGGHDALWGDAGRDTLTGGTGDDTLRAGQGDDSLEGGEGDDSLGGGDGSDRLDAGTGSDVLDGGNGDDRYTIRGAAQLIVEAEDGGFDTVNVLATSYALSDHVENARLMGSGRHRLAGNAQDNELTGWAGNDTLEGGAGNDTLQGTSGTNRLVGGTGDDEYLISAGDVVVEGAGGGIDTVIVTGGGGYVLPAEVENASVGDGELVGNAQDNALTCTGYGLVVRGRGGNDTMTGGVHDDLFGGTGDDTYVVMGSGAEMAIHEVAGEGTDTLVVNQSAYLDDNLENLTLTGSAFEGFGNRFDNVIRGSASVNWLYGREGADTLLGGGGNDSYIVEDAGDVIVETALGGDRDTVYSRVSHTLATNVERLVLEVEWGEWDLRLNGTGNEQDNVLEGHGGANVLDGKGGDDTLDGGSGNDTYVVDSVRDVVVEEARVGSRDTVRASVNITLATEVEVLVLVGAATRGVGNAADNEIRGNAADNRLDGGAGADRMLGADGDDTYVVDSAGDRALESAAEGGIDTVLSKASFTLTDHVEKLVLVGSRSSKGTGNAQANTIIGNAAANELDGRGGADTLSGGLGNDVYVIDDGDVVVEAAGGGTDTIVSGASHVLGAQLENLTLNGVLDVDARGNGLANVLQGNEGDNRLDGRAGADTMHGGYGADVYVVDHAADVASETHWDGLTDTVIASVDYTLGAFIDDLVLAAGAVRGVGNDEFNRLDGNALNNVLDGGGGDDILRGGDGNDTLVGGGSVDELYGGAGSDRFVFTSGIDSNLDMYDAIYDFAPGDRIDLSLVDGDTQEAGKQSLRFVRGQGSAAGDVWCGDIDGYLAVFVNTDGDAAPDLVFVVVGVSDLAGADFIF